MDMDTQTKKKDQKTDQKEDKVQQTAEQHMGGILAIIADTTHNFTDGLAIAASFSAGHAIGVSTTIAVLVHEIPHEIGDFALLVQSGFTMRSAILVQLLTAIGALVGVGVGLLTGGLTESTAWALPFTAGGFIYIAAVDVLPTLLKDTSLVQTLAEVSAMCVGVYMMVLIAEYE